MPDYDPYGVGTGNGNGKAWMPAIVVGGIVLGLMVVFVLVVVQQRKADVDKHQVEDARARVVIEQALAENKRTLCSFMTARAKQTGLPKEEPPATARRNDILAAEAAKLLKLYGC